ncbi:MAG TPA: hypothetical protein VNN76_02920 [Bacteroidota bacterium]|nr:hypothetical protein [Bacteroidota bacterium]
MSDHQRIVRALLEFSQDIRYVAILQDGKLTFRQREHIPDASVSETDRFEELVVNPTLLTLARHRGDIDCGGLRFLIVGYGNFFQLIREIRGGHISVCLKKEADLTKLPEKVFEYLNSQFPTLF